MSAIDGKVITRKQQRIFEDGWCLRTKKRKAYSVKKKDNWKVRLCAMPSKQFYRTKTWFKLRRRVLEEYGYRCMLCGSLDDIQVDHIRPRSREPHLSLEFSNLQVLCKDCNREKSNIHAEDYREEAAMIELDRQAYLDALDRGL